MYIFYKKNWRCIYFTKNLRCIFFYKQNWRRIFLNNLRWFLFNKTKRCIFFDKKIKDIYFVHKKNLKMYMFYKKIKDVYFFPKKHTYSMLYGRPFTIRCGKVLFSETFKWCSAVCLSQNNTFVAMSGKLYSWSIVCTF
jgi:hypothetical protein